MKGHGIPLLRWMPMIGALLAAAPLAADTVTLVPTKDNTLYQYVSVDGDRSNGAGSYLFAGSTDDGRTRRAVLAFDIAGNVPAGSTITSVTLTLQMTRSTSGVESQSLHKVLADWGEGTSNAGSNEGQGAPATPGDATWRHRFYSAILWSTPGGDYVPTASATASVGATGAYSWTSTGMVADAQGWLDTPGSSFGWILIGRESASHTTKRFNSRSSSPPPQLTIVFTPPQIQGACCLGGGTCAELTPSQCSAQGGTYQGNGTPCSPNPCGTVEGPMGDSSSGPRVNTNPCQ